MNPYFRIKAVFGEPDSPTVLNMFADHFVWNEINRRFSAAGVNFDAVLVLHVEDFEDELIVNYAYANPFAEAL